MPGGHLLSLLRQRKEAKKGEPTAPAARCASGARVSGPSGGACATRYAQTGAGSNPPADPLTRQAPNGQKQKQRQGQPQRQRQRHACDPRFSLVVPAQAGTQVHHRSHWAPAFAGVTHEAPSFPRAREPSGVERDETEQRHWVPACARTTNRDQCSVSPRTTKRNRALRQREARPDSGNGEAEPSRPIVMLPIHGGFERVF